jgi:uncharacterized membrane protein
MRHLPGDERGVVFPLVAIFLVVIVAAAALGIDVANIVQANRQLQKVADLAALDAARVLDGSPNASVFPAVCQAAIASAKGRNSFTTGSSCAPPSALVVVTGVWNTTTRTFTPAALPTDVPNAVEVTASQNIRYFFGAGSQTDSRSGVATGPLTAGVEVGTLTAAAGSPLFCAVADALAPGPCVAPGSYSGLAAAHVSVVDLAGAGGFGSPDTLLSGAVTFQQMTTMMAQALTNQGDTQDAQIVTQMQSLPNKPFQLGTLLQGFQGNPAAASAQLDVLDVILGCAQLADGGAAIAVPNLGISIPGLTSSSANVSAIQAPAFTWGARGASATASQVNVTLNLQIGPQAFSVTVTGGEGTALLDHITCANPVSASTVDVLASSNALSAQVSGLGAADVPGVQPPVPLTFTPMSTPPSPPQTIGPTTDLAQTLVNAVPALAPIEPTLAQTLDPLAQAVGVQVGGAVVSSPGPTPPQTICPAPTLVH